MKKFKDIIAVIDKQKIRTKDFVNEDFDSASLIEETGPFELVEEKGGNEGDGEYAVRVWHFLNHDVYVQITGFFSSYSGTDWDENFREVFPHSRTITVYTDKKGEGGTSEADGEKDSVDSEDSIW